MPHRVSFLEDLNREREAADQRTWDKHGATLDLLFSLREAIAVSIDAIEENERLRADRDYWKRQYDETIQSSIQHGEKMMGNLLNLAINCEIKPRAAGAAEETNAEGRS